MEMHQVTLIFAAVLLFLLAKVTIGTCPYQNDDIDFSGTFIGNVLSRNSLQSCPKNVSSINLAYNLIDTIDNDTFDDFYQLVSINLTGNQLSDLPDGLLFFQRSLQVIDISDNQLQELRNGLFRDTLNLKYVHLQNNNISFIDTDVLHKDLIMLLLFNVSRNQMTYFEPWPYIPKTQGTGEDFIFDIQNNKISKFTNNMNYTYDLVYPFDFVVNLQGNEISKVDRDTFMIYHTNYSGPFLTELMTFEFNLTGNPFFCDCNVYEVVNEIQSSFFLYYNVEEFRYICDAPSEHHGVDFLHDMELEDFVCNVTDKCPAGCFCQERPYTSELLVDCTNNGLYQLPDELPEPQYGKISLKLDNNHIRQFTKKSYTSQLKSVTMSRNNLIYIEPAALTEMNRVNQPQYFDVSENALQYLPKEIKVFSAFDDIRVSGNNFVCDCNMTWLGEWVKLSANAPDIGVICTAEDGDTYRISEVTDDLLLCSFGIIAIAISVSLGVLSAIIIGIVVTAKRCPYETKVLLHRIFRIHPQDNYKVDLEEDKLHDIYFSYETENYPARQWLRKYFLRKLEKKQKRKCKVFIPEKDAQVGEAYGDELITNMRKSRRIIFLITDGFLENEWNAFEAFQSEMEHNSSDNLHGRVLYILWNNDIRQKIKTDPWRSRMDGKRVLCPDEKLFWSKILYELPKKW